MTAEELELHWHAIAEPTHPTTINGRRAPSLPAAVAAYLAVDDKTHRHLLVRLPDDSRLVQPQETRGLVVRTQRYVVGSYPEALYADLECSDASQYRTFSAFALDLVDGLAHVKTSVVDTVSSCLARWRTFWKATTEALGQDRALGLYGELWFMRWWLPTLGVGAVLAWQVTEDALHDFQWPAASVEVKTASTRAEALPIHTINGLRQLAPPQQGTLYLFSLHLREDELGPYNLDELVRETETRMRDSWEATTHLNQRLAARGYTPETGTNTARRYRVLGQRLYRVTSGFPRLTVDSFLDGGPPVGVLDITYSIDTATCMDCLVADSPDTIEASQFVAMLQE